MKWIKDSHWPGIFYASGRLGRLYELSRNEDSTFSITVRLPNCEIDKLFIGKTRHKEWAKDIAEALEKYLVKLSGGSNESNG